MRPSPPNWSHGYLKDEKCFVKKQKHQTAQGAKSECDGLFTNRLLWLSASAGGSAPPGLRLPQPRPAGAFVNKPYPLLTTTEK